MNLFFLRLQATADPSAVKATKTSFQVVQFTIDSENQNPAARLKPLLLIILTENALLSPFPPSSKLFLTLK
jgi:hypothetical protein